MSTEDIPMNKEEIALKNDLFRSTFIGGRVMLTAGVQNDANLDKVIQAVKLFNTFTEDNDPYGERDFGAITLDDEQYLWKIDYYENEHCKYGFDFDSNEVDTAFRVLTIMLSTDY